MHKTSIVIGSVVAAAIATVAYAATNRVSVEEKGGERCILSNGIPDHATGSFPNRGNPNRISTQDIEFCVTRSPEKGSTARRAQYTGIMKNGILIRPGTADWYDASSSRGHSRDRSSGWNLDGMGPDNTLGIDAQNAHVDNRGIYHYHGMPDALKGTASETFVGYAADGFEIHYVGSAAQSSWQLKSGTRPTAPYGAYDGSYNQDFEYVAGSGNLDECNGASVDGKYMYFATDTYPYFSRCLYGTEISSYGGGERGGGQRGERANGNGGIFSGLFGQRPPRRN